MNQHIKLLTLLLLVVTWTYFPLFNNGFVDWDDVPMLLQDERLRDTTLQGVWNVFHAHLTFEYSRIVPVAYWTFLLDFFLGKGHPFSFHVTSYLIHVLNVTAVYVLIVLLSSNRLLAWGTALVFGIHPLAVESVAWASARAHPLFALFYINTLIFYILASRQQQRRRIYEGLALVSYLASLLSCAFAVTLPAVLFLIDYRNGKKWSWTSFREKLPYIALSAFFCFLTVAAAKYSYEFEVPYLTDRYSLAHRARLSALAMLLNIGKMVVPVNLKAIDPIDLVPDRLLNNAAMLFPVVAVFVVVLLRRLRSRDANFWTFFFLVTTLPFLHFYGASESIISDRYLYVPLIAFGYVLTKTAILTLEKFATPSAKYFFQLSLVFYLAFFGILTHERIDVWQNSYTFWSNMIRHFPHLPSGYIARGNTLRALDEIDLAVKDYNRAIALEPDKAQPYYEKARALFKIKDLTGSIQNYAQAINRNPAHASAYNDRGIAYSMTGHYDKAVEDFDRAVLLERGNLNYRKNRGMVYFMIGEDTSAEVDLEAVFQFRPDDTDVAEKLKAIRARSNSKSKI